MCVNMYVFVDNKVIVSGKQMELKVCARHVRVGMFACVRVLFFCACLLSWSWPRALTCQCYSGAEMPGRPVGCDGLTGLATDGRKR